MKRNIQDYAGRPKRENLSRDVVGQRLTHSVPDVASFLDARRGDPQSDAQIVDEFSEFLSGGADPDHPFSADHDPGFREHLRRRLWRLHVTTQPSTSTEPH